MNTEQLDAIRLTPQQVRDWEFPPSLHGMDPHVVSACQETVAQEVELLHAELERMQQETPDRARQSARVLLAAEQQRAQLITAAQEKAERLIGEAGQEAKLILDRARASAERSAVATVEDATREAAEILAQAPLDAQARTTALEALGSMLHTHLTAVLSGLEATLDTYRSQCADPVAALAAVQEEPAALPAHAAGPKRRAAARHPASASTGQ